MGFLGKLLFGSDDSEPLKQEYVSRFGEPSENDGMLPDGVENDQPGYERLFNQLKASDVEPYPDGWGEPDRDSPPRGFWGKLFG